MITWGVLSFNSVTPFSLLFCHIACINVCLFHFGMQAGSGGHNLVQLCSSYLAFYWPCSAVSIVIKDSYEYTSLNFRSHFNLYTDLNIRVARFFFSCISGLKQDP